MKKVLFAGHDFKFLASFIEFLKEQKNISVRVEQWQGHNIHQLDESLANLAWADVIFCEWCLGNAVFYSRHKRENQKLLIRCHAQELKTNYPKDVKVHNVDRFIAISPYIYEAFYQQCRFPRHKMKMIYNYVETKHFNQEKEEDALLHLGIIGICPKLKRLDRALTIFEGVWEKDSRVQFHIKGKRPEEYPWVKKEEQQKRYYEEVMARIEEAPWKNNLHFDGFGDVSLWLRQIGVVLSTSDYESFHLGPVEGMASGAYPIVIKRKGADTIFPKESIVKDEQEGIERILTIQRQRQFYEFGKEYVQQLFDSQIIFEQLLREF